MHWLVSLLLVVSSIHLLAQPAGDWNQWRGPGRDGIAASFTAPAAWPDQPTQVWKVNAGVGHSSPVVSGSRVYLFSRIGEQEVMTAYEAATGRQVWRDAYDTPYRMSPAATGHGKGPKSTPVVSGGRIFALGISGILSAYDAVSGKVLWRRDFSSQFRSTSPEFGASMSPIVDGESVIAHVGGDGSGAIAGFAVANGAERWAWKGDGPAYASPVIATFGGVRHLITQTQSHIVGISPADGRELWRTRFTTDYDQNIVTPAIAGGMLIYSGLAKATTAVRVVQEGGAWKLQQVWQNADLPMYMSSPVAVGGVLYGLTHRNRGQFFGLDVETGKTLWTSQPRQGENAALSAAGDLLIATTTDARLVVMRQGRTHQVLREYAHGWSPIWAHHVLHGRGILIKDTETLSYWTF
ncbi:MAG TPA: PQQ-binding-like beta-propeller repeat protein [Vicinamibacterales bacterium]|nr:PQQ-binding-like beta-propeller repeat protein [Vicinamibacterales bacterium]